MSLPGFIRIMQAQQTKFKSISSSPIFWKSVELVLFFSLNVWQISPVKPWPRNSFKKASWGNCRDLLICFLFLRDHCPLLPNLQCLKNHYFIDFVSCSRQEGKSGLYHSILFELDARGLKLTKSNTTTFFNKYYLRLQYLFFSSYVTLLASIWLLSVIQSTKLLF